MSRLKQGTCTIPVLQVFMEPSMLIIIIAIDPLRFINFFQISSHQPSHELFKTRAEAIVINLPPKDFFVENTGTSIAR